MHVFLKISLLSDCSG